MTKQRNQPIFHTKGLTLKYDSVLTSLRILPYTFSMYLFPSRIDPALKSTVYCTVIREGDQKEWNFMFEQYMAATVPSEKRRLLAALTCARKAWIINK